MSVDAGSKVDPVAERLRLLAHESPDLKDAAGIYEMILPLIRKADLKAAPVPITADDFCEKMAKGVHMLADIDLDLDVCEVSELMSRLAYAIEKAGEKRGVSPDNTAARNIRMAVEQNLLDVSELLLHIASGKRGPVVVAAKRLNLDPDLLWTLSLNAIRPALQLWRRQLAPMKTEEMRWDRNYCFICGATATIGELRGDTQARHLRCGQCGADWRVSRLRCMYCGNEDHNSLGFIRAGDGNEKVRAEVCDKCHCYLKVIAAFFPTPPEMLTVEDLVTLDMDYIAKERGYIKHPPPG